jgi:hypothetical protein
VEVNDAAGRTKRPFITLHVILEPTVLACGDSASGVFEGSGYAGADPDFDYFGGHEWLAVELPDDDTTRVSLQWTLERAITAYVERPNEVIGSWDTEEHYVPRVMDQVTGNTELRIDASSQPSLSGYAAQELLPILAVAQTAGAWEVTVECSDGPIFVTVPQYPTELGKELEYDFDVYNEPAGTRIYTPDELPEWMIWDEATGQVTGTAEEVGSWPFTLIAESPDGRIREERSIIGVYEVREVGCGDRVQATTLDGYFDGEFTTYYDTDGYHVYRMGLGEDVLASTVEIQLSGLDASFMGTADPDPGWLKFFPGAERIYGGFYPSLFRLDPRTYPAMKHYREVEEIYFQVAPTGLERSYTLDVTCDDTPRPDLAGLPVIPIFEPVDEDFPAVGGQAPYLWTAEGLPTGLQLSTEGKLTGSVGEQLESLVTLTVEDKLGAEGSDSYPLYSSVEAACEGDTLVRCGDTVTGTFSSSYFADPSYTSPSASPWRRWTPSFASTSPTPAAPPTSSSTRTRASTWPTSTGGTSRASASTPSASPPSRTTPACPSGWWCGPTTTATGGSRSPASSQATSATSRSTGSDSSDTALRADVHTTTRSRPSSFARNRAPSAIASTSRQSAPMRSSASPNDPVKLGCSGCASLIRASSLRSRSRLRWAASMLAPGHTKTNSSPPQRHSTSSARTVADATLAKVRSARSPASWP